MSEICYIPKRFREESNQIILNAAIILEEYQQQQLTMTLRQLYYQFVSRDLLPEKWRDKITGSKNNIKSYKNLGSLLNDARLAGLIDWDLMKDETRGLKSYGSWSSPHRIIRAAASSYNIDKWIGQEYRPEIWVEKDALIGVVAHACNPIQVPHFSCRGYTSQTAMWEAGMRLIGNLERNQKPYIIHLGDHDPSGIDMSRDIFDRLCMFVDRFADASRMRFERIALNMDQIREYDPPPNPAKVTDSRYESYVLEYGEESWELDALDPNVIVQLITDAIMSIRDHDKYEARVEREEEERKQLQWVADNWDNISNG